MPLNVDRISTGSLSVNGTEINKNGGLPYKVYTALLTQSGGDEETGLNSGTLLIGRTYYINDGVVDAPDFTNVGAPNNDAGTYFVATGEVPNNWGMPTSTSGVLRYNTGAPVVTVLENTIGNVWFTYVEDGFYNINQDSNFIPEKTFVILTNNVSGDITLANNMAIGFELYQDSSNIFINTFSNGIATRGVLFNTPIEIRVYN